MSDIVMPLDYPNNDEALRELVPKLERKLSDIETGLLQDTKYNAMMAVGDDADVRYLHFLWVFILTPLYFISAIAAFIIQYIFAVREEYDNLKEIEDENFNLPSFSSWVFKGCKSGTYYKRLGPVSWSLIFLFGLLPIIIVQGQGEQFAKTWHYFALKDDLKHIRKKINVRESHPLTFEKALEVIRRDERFQAIWVYSGTVAAAFFATNFVEALLNLLAIHFVAECDKYDLRNLVINKFSIVTGTRLQKLFQKTLWWFSCFYQGKKRLKQEEYEKIWSLKDEPAGEPHANDEPLAELPEEFIEALDNMDKKREDILVLLPA